MKETDKVRGAFDAGRNGSLWNELGPPHVLQVQPCADSAAAGGAGQGRVQMHRAAHAGISSQDDEAERAKWRTVPVRLQRQGHRREGRCLPKRTINPQHARIGDGGVSAGRVGFDAKMPPAWLRQPKREIGLGQGERCFFHAEFEVEAGSAGLNVRKPGQATRASLLRWSCRDMRGA